MVAHVYGKYRDYTPLLFRDIASKGLTSALGVMFLNICFIITSQISPKMNNMVKN